MRLRILALPAVLVGLALLTPTPAQATEHAKRGSPCTTVGDTQRDRSGDLYTCEQRSQPPNSSSPPVVYTPPVSVPQLPVTGAKVWVLVASGAAVLGVGALIRWVTRRPPRHRRGRRTPKATPAG